MRLSPDVLLSSTSAFAPLTARSATAGRMTMPFNISPRENEKSDAALDGRNAALPVAALEARGRSCDNRSAALLNASTAGDLPSRLAGSVSASSQLSQTVRGILQQRNSAANTQTLL